MGEGKAVGRYTQRSIKIRLRSDNYEATRPRCAPPMNILFYLSHASFGTALGLLAGALAGALAAPLIMGAMVMFSCRSLAPVILKWVRPAADFGSNAFATLEELPRFRHLWPLGSARQYALVCGLVSLCFAATASWAYMYGFAGCMYCALAALVTHNLVHTLLCWGLVGFLMSGAVTDWRAIFESSEFRQHVLALYTNIIQQPPRTRTGNNVPRTTGVQSPERLLLSERIRPRIKAVQPQS